MRIAVVTRALRVPTDEHRWISVPPEGYSGIHWVVANLIDGLLHRGHHVYLLGAPGTRHSDHRLTVVDAAETADVEAWLATSTVDIIHDHSCGQVNPERIPPGWPYLSTHHLTGRPAHPRNCVYLSTAQRSAAGSSTAPVIRIPVNAGHYTFAREKDGYLLYMGRISAFKGVYEAAAFAHAAGRRLVAAGPSWEEEYRLRIESDFGRTVQFLGEVGGTRRITLFAAATAAMVLSQTLAGPWGGSWCEPGATVVSEAAVCGTPVIATANGCLSEIAPHVGVLVPEGASFTSDQAAEVLASLPTPDHVRTQALARWDHVQIARQYEELYHLVRSGTQWT